MNLKEKLLNLYYEGQLNEDKMTSLRRFIALTGRDYKRLTPQQIDKIANTSAYKQFRKLRSMLRMQKKSEELKKKLQNEDVLTEYKRAPIIGTAKRIAHPDVGQFHKHQVHVKKGLRKAFVRKKIISTASKSPVVIHTDPAYALFPKGTGQRGHVAMGKGKTAIRGIKRGGIKKTYYEDINIDEAKVVANVETPDVKTKLETKPFSKKTENVMMKMKKVKLNKDGDNIIVNPSLDQSKDTQD